MQSQRLVIAVPIEDDLLSPLYAWGKKFDFTHVESVLFLHVVKMNITPLEFGLVESPDEVTYHEMIPTLENFVRQEAKKIIPTDYQGKIDFEITKDFHPEEEVIDILKNINATLIVVATRGRHGIDSWFHTSFTSYMVKHAPCDVFVIRPPEQDEISQSA